MMAAGRPQVLTTGNVGQRNAHTAGLSLYRNVCNKIRRTTIEKENPLFSYNTHTTTTVLRPFVRDYPGEPVPEETLTHPQS